jgi:hypothetical protein
MAVGGRKISAGVDRGPSMHSKVPHRRQWKSYLSTYYFLKSIRGIFSDPTTFFRPVNQMMSPAWGKKGTVLIIHKFQSRQ